MATVVRTEIRKRGFFGWVFFLMFLGFNAVMAWSLLAGLADIGGQTPADANLRAAHEIGATIGVGILLIVWAAGAVILGLLVMLTRGSKSIIEEVVA